MKGQTEGRRRGKGKRLVSLLVVSGVLTSIMIGPAATAASAADRYTFDSGLKTLSPSAQASAARTWAGVALMAAPHCVAATVMDKVVKRWGVRAAPYVAGIWVGINKAVSAIIGADSGCTMAKKASLVAAGLMLGYLNGTNGTYRMKILHDDIAFRPDLCRVFVYVRGTWVLGSSNPISYWGGC